MNLTLQILIAPATHTISDPAKIARRYAQGDLVCIWDSDVVAPYNGTAHLMRDVISTVKYVFVHVRNVPAQVTLDRARNRLLAEDIDVGTFEGEVVIIGYYRRKKFGVALANIPTNIRNRLLSDREITVTWTQVRNYIKHIRENRQLVDGDV